MKTETINSEQMQQLTKYGVPIEKIQSASILRFSAGETLCLAGMPMQSLYFVLQGKAQVLLYGDNGAALGLAYFDDYGILDDLELFLKEDIFHVSCRATTDMICAALPLAQNAPILLADHDFILSVCTGFAYALQRNQNQFHSLIYPLESQLCSFILFTERDGLWQENLTRTAETFGVSYRHLLRVIKGFCEKEILQKTDGGYRILNRAYIQQLDKGFYSPVEPQISP